MPRRNDTVAPTAPLVINCRNRRISVKVISANRQIATQSPCNRHRIATESPQAEIVPQSATMTHFRLNATQWPSSDRWNWLLRAECSSVIREKAAQKLGCRPRSEGAVELEARTAPLRRCDCTPRAALASYSISQHSARASPKDADRSR